MPPMFFSRSTTITLLTPNFRSSIAAASPDGPAPTITTSGSYWFTFLLLIQQRLNRLAAGAGEDRRDLCGAKEPPTATHPPTRAPSQSIKIARGDDCTRCIAHRVLGHALAVAD